MSVADAADLSDRVRLVAAKFGGVVTVMLAALWIGACAEAETDADAGIGADDDGGGPGPTIDAGDPGPTIDAGGGGGLTASCPAGEFATGLGPKGGLACAPLDGTVRDAVNEHCSLYYGWRDSCDGCVTPPAKWGRTNQTSCTVGVGANSTCTTPTLGEQAINLLGINTDGDVNDDDKFYVGLHCTDAVNTGTIVPCRPGEFLARVEGTPVCRTAAVAVAKYAQQHCQLHIGWRDSCDGCTTPPAKWGRAGMSGCQNGAGTDNTCIIADLGGVMVNAFGLNTDGGIDGNDKFYLGISCAMPEESTMQVAGTCPDDMLVTGIASNGDAVCTNPGPATATVVRRDCYAYQGWRDSCDGCTTDPAKWGRTSHNICELGVGADDTCISADLGGTEVRLIGVNTDGDVNDDDKFYVGLGCF